jgi:hypothetical protein
LRTIRAANGRRKANLQSRVRLPCTYRNPLPIALLAEIVDALKRLLRSQGITYAPLATRLGVSEATVKRIYSPSAP